MLDRNAILSCHDVKVQTIDVPEWGQCCIRVINGAERDALEAEFTANKGKPAANFRGRFAALILCDAQGVRLFSDKDAVQLGLKSALALEAVLKAGMDLSGIGPREAAKLLGESETAQSVAFGSNLP